MRIMRIMGIMRRKHVVKNSPAQQDSKFSKCGNRPLSPLCLFSPLAPNNRSAQPDSKMSKSGERYSDPLEVNVAAFDIRAQQLHTDFLADVQPLSAADYSAFHRDIQQPRPSTFVGGAGYDGVKLLANPCFQQHRSGGLADPAAQLSLPRLP